MRKLTTGEFVERARLVHGDKWDYSRADYVDMATKVEIVCPKHGSFFQTPSNHLKGHGCPTCNRIDAQRITMDEFLACSRVVHGDRYDYSRVKFEGTKSKVEIVCPVHGPFMQTPENIKSRVTSRNLYGRMVRIWTVTDPEKRRTALANGLNYLVFWDEDLTDFHTWYDNFDENPVLKNV